MPEAHANPHHAKRWLHGYATAFWWAAAIFATGAVLCTALLSSRSRAVAAAGVERDSRGEPAAVAV
jgi:hypothetical protein